MTDKSLIVNDLILDKKSLRVYQNEKEILLTKTEFKLLEYLMTNKNCIKTRDQILDYVWGYNWEGVESRVVDVYIGYLRKKGINIESRRGFGYLMEESK